MNRKIMTLIREHDINSYAELIRYLKEIDDKKLLRYARNNTLPIRAYLISVNYRAR